jgi:hypothetical protein
MEVTNKELAEAIERMHECPHCGLADEILPAIISECLWFYCLPCYVRWQVSPLPIPFEPDWHDPEIAKLVEEEWELVDPPIELECESSNSPTRSVGNTLLTSDNAREVIRGMVTCPECEGSDETFPVVAAAGLMFACPICRVKWLGVKVNNPALLPFAVGRDNHKQRAARAVAKHFREVAQRVEVETSRPDAGKDIDRN